MTFNRVISTLQELSNDLIVLNPLFMLDFLSAIAFLCTFCAEDTARTEGKNEYKILLKKKPICIK